MCNPACKAYGQSRLVVSNVQGKRVIEVGSRNVNGSLRSHVEQLGPASYLGVDIEAGPGVDEVCDAEDLVARFGVASFDLAVCTEVLEHVRDWRTVIANLKQLLDADGVLLITTRSVGFPYHAFPYDFWRYEVDDMRTIFADMTIEDVDTDPGAPGVFITVRRPSELVESDLADVELYSMIKRRRCRDISDFDLDVFTKKRRALQLGGKLLPPKIKNFVKGERAPSA